MRFDRIVPPAADTPLAELEVEGAKLDLHGFLQFIGLTYGPDDGSVTMGWTATREVTLRHDGNSGTLAGLALTWTEVSRFEASFQAAAGAALRPGAMDYFEFRNDPEATMVFFFELGTLRISGGALHGEVLFEEPSPFPVIQ